MTCMLRLAAALFQVPAPPGGWRSMTMRRLDAALTPPDAGEPGGNNPAVEPGGCRFCTRVDPAGRVTYSIFSLPG